MICLFLLWLTPKVAENLAEDLIERERAATLLARRSLARRGFARGAENAGGTPAPPLRRQLPRGALHRAFDHRFDDGRENSAVLFAIARRALLAHQPLPLRLRILARQNREDGARRDRRQLVHRRVLGCDGERLARHR